MASDEGFALGTDLRKRLDSIAKKRAEKAAEERAAQEILRRKIVGVLIKQARLDANKSLQETATVMSCSTSRLSQYESGEKAPSLPEVEMLARFLSVPLSHLLDETRRREEKPPLPPVEVIPIRHKIIGVQLRQARRAAGLTQKQLAQEAGCSPGRISQYERGERGIPMTELEILIDILGLRSADLVDSDLGPDSPEARRQRDLENLTQIPENMRDFVLSPVNSLYLEMAMKVSSLPVDIIRQIAESLLDITY
jgi:transcriptional regulator with XRE-family HTH domain